MKKAVNARLEAKKATPRRLTTTRLGDHDNLHHIRDIARTIRVLAKLIIHNYKTPSIRPLHGVVFRPLHHEERTTARTYSQSSSMLRRRQDDGLGGCHSGIAYNPAEYNLNLHIGSVFVVLAVSTFACAFPMLVLRFPRLRIPARVLFVVRHFGTGVLIATAFVHLLPTAFISLGDPCLSGFWTEDYPAMPGAITLLAIFLIAGIEMSFSPEKRCCAAPMNASGVAKPSHKGANRTVTDNERRSGDMEISTIAKCPPAGEDHDKNHEHSETEYDPDAKINLTTEQEHRKAFLQCVLLEMGILFHSVFIGMNLSVSSGREFVILFIAIVFHRKWWCLSCKQKPVQSVSSLADSKPLLQKLSKA